MVLGWRRPGRVGRCRIPWKKGLTPNGVGLFFSYNQRVLLPDYPNQCAALYLVRIFPAARNAGCRQEKSHGRVGEMTRKKRFLFRLQCPYFLVIFDQVRERTWLGSSLWQKDLLFKAGFSCISENHSAIMQMRNSFWNVHETRAAGRGIYTATNALIRDGCGEFSMFSQMLRIGHNQWRADYEKRETDV